MNQKESLNPQIVHDAAAFLFWRLAEVVGVNRANEAVMCSSGLCLLEQPFTSDTLSQYGFGRLLPNEQREFSSAIAVEALRFGLKGENMDGIIYAEDAQGGRSPSAKMIQTACLDNIPRRIVASGYEIERIGWLCIRHPLPAVVFSNACPRGGVLEVADTSLALRFQLPMFLSRCCTTRLGSRLFVSTGILHIPVPNNDCGDNWGAAVQNSERFIYGIQFCGPDGNTEVEVEW